MEYETHGAMDATLPAGFAARPPALTDAATVAGLIGACRVADGDDNPITTAELLRDWEQLNLEREAVIVVDAHGALAAYADLNNRRNLRVSVYGYVHPAFRGRGLGGYLVTWGEHRTAEFMERAPADARVTADHYLRSSNEAARALLAGRGYDPIRAVYVMTAHLEAPEPPPDWPKGTGVRTFEAGRDEDALVSAGEDAFREMWNRPPGTYESWVRPTRSPQFDPSLWFLAEDAHTGEIAGFCLSQALPDQAWIDALGVRSGWRNRGLGLALLRHAFAEYRRRGLEHVELSVDADSPTGAPRLYTRAGMSPRETYIVYSKMLRRGRDYSTLSEYSD